ncbi:MAG: PAS domain S-box protein [bacterium]|nr:PAS domain S-box protein [bacterium]
MTMQFRRSVPLYRKLRLESRILLVFIPLLILVAGIVLVAVRVTTERYVSEVVLDQSEVMLGEQLADLSDAVARDDRPALDRILDEVLAIGGDLEYLIVLDQAGHPLTHVASAPEMAAALATDLAARSGLPYRSNWGAEAVREDQLVLMIADEPAGTVVVGRGDRLGRRLANRTVLVALAILVVPIVMLLGITRLMIRGAIGPLKELTRVAEEISTGNLDPRIDFGVHVNCWEIKDCQRTDCRAYLNFTEQCWYIDGTPCEGYESRFPQKLAGCRGCEVYQAHRGDEVVQLADAFKHMTNVLKGSRKELVDSSDFQKRLIQNSFDGIIASNEEDVITIFNDVAEILTGYSGEEVIGRLNWQVFFDIDLAKSLDLPLSHEPVRRLRGFSPKESVVRNAAGEWIDVQLAGICLFESGLHLGNVFFFKDMREVKTLRANLIQSERMTAAGRAAASISHSIKNILDGLNGGIYVYKAGLRRGDEEKKTAGWGMIERNTQIIADLVADLLNFAKDRKPEYEPHDPLELVRRVVDDIGLGGDGEVNIQARRVGPVRRVMLDGHAFHQCLGNLIRNAAEAFPTGGPGEVWIEVEVGEGWTRFSVSDNGVGMSPQTIDKIENGMYTTKGSKGTGLGLQVSRKIVNEHRGTMTIESRENVGSSFVIKIPTRELSSEM